MALPTIGELRELFVFRARYEEPTSGGATTETFVDVFTTRAKIKPISSITRIDMAQINTPVTHKAWIRYRTDVNDRQWIEWDDRRFNIKGHQYVGERKQFVELLLEEIELLIAPGIPDEGG